MMDDGRRIIDVDPEWVENFNSVQDLKYAALATVSRCGMIWFSEEVLSLEMIYENYFTLVKRTLGRQR